MTARQYNFTKQNGVVMKAKRRFTKQNGVVKRILSGWTKTNGVVEQVYSLNRITQKATFFNFPNNDGFNYKLRFATIDGVYASKLNDGVAKVIANYWDTPVVQDAKTSLGNNSSLGWNEAGCFNYAGGVTSAQSFTYSEASTLRETNLSTMDVVDRTITGQWTAGRGSHPSIKIDTEQYIIPTTDYSDTLYYLVNASTYNIQTVSWNPALPFTLNGGKSGAITLSAGYGIIFQATTTDLCFVVYNNGVVSTKVEPFVIGSDYINAAFTPNGQDVILDISSYGVATKIVKFNPVSRLVSVWQPGVVGAVLGAYAGYVFFARLANEPGLAFYVDKYNISGQVVSSTPIELPSGFSAPTYIGSDDDVCTKHSGRFAAIVISNRYGVVFDLSKL